jgi:hypothetical protein
LGICLYAQLDTTIAHTADILELVDQWSGSIAVVLPRGVQDKVLAVDLVGRHIHVQRNTEQFALGAQTDFDSAPVPVSIRLASTAPVGVIVLRRAGGCKHAEAGRTWRNLTIRCQRAWTPRSTNAESFLAEAPCGSDCGGQRNVLMKPTPIIITRIQCKRERIGFPFQLARSRWSW